MDLTGVVRDNLKQERRERSKKKQKRALHKGVLFFGVSNLKSVSLVFTRSKVEHISRAFLFWSQLR